MLNPNQKNLSSELEQKTKEILDDLVAVYIEEINVLEKERDLLLQRVQELESVVGIFTQAKANPKIQNVAATEGLPVGEWLLAEIERRASFYNFKPIMIDPSLYAALKGIADARGVLVDQLTITEGFATRVASLIENLQI